MNYYNIPASRNTALSMYCEIYFKDWFLYGVEGEVQEYELLEHTSRNMQ